MKIIIPLCENPFIMVVSWIKAEGLIAIAQGNALRGGIRHGGLP
ncbi:hypothetical protein ACT3CD_08435 [Geofilum sp. OHC36d9]